MPRWFRLRELAPFAAALSGVLTACSDNTPTAPVSATAGSATQTSGAGGGLASAGGTGGAPPLGGAGTATTGGSTSGGTTGGGGRGGEAGGGVPSGGGGNTSAGNGGSAGTGGGNSACPANAILCDDFEKYTDGATDLSPDWIAYTYSGALKVDSSKPRGGKQSLHLNVQQGMRHYADIIRETRGQELVPLHHFGRMMVWITQVPQGAQHWNLNISSGPLTGYPEEIAKFAEGGMFGKLMSNYAQRARAKSGDEYLLRGGGPEQGDAPADADCAVAAPAQTITAGKWVCWEWEFDGPNDTARLWIDGTAMTEIDAVGHGKQCQGPGFAGKPMNAEYAWEGPLVFDKVIIGWEQYQDMPAQEVWIDDVVVGGERVMCPPP